MPKYFFGGYWPEQTDKWTAGEVQRLEIEYRIFIRPKRWFEIFVEHYENILTKDGKFDNRYNQRLHNVVGFRFWIVP